jgi:dihydropteroate synthase
LKITEKTDYEKHFLNLKGDLVDISTPIVMGVLNVTPDSFYDGGKYTQEKAILQQAEGMLSEGASIIDIGGYSSRPGAIDISTEEEEKRVVESIKLVSKTFPEAYISVDTFRASVARESIEAGACIINDISGGTLDEKMFDTVAEMGVPYVLMHMRGTPQTMTQHTSYDNLLLDMLNYFQRRVAQLRAGGVADIIIDPGFGFAKTPDQSYEVLRQLASFQVLSLPVMAGLSRKSMIYRKLGITPQEALNGTTVLNTVALMNGATILRVHDVKEAIETIKLYKLTYH